MRPSRSSYNYLILRALNVQISQAVRAHLPLRRAAEVLDIGGGAQPYRDILEPYAKRYQALDRVRRPGIDIVGDAESIPLPDGSIDCVLCTQVLEHVDAPNSVVAEIRRVLKPGGLGLVSTHGVYRYHANPNDYWRWTHEGLAKLFTDVGGWTDLRVLPNGGFCTAVAYILGAEISEVAERAKLRSLGRAACLAMNAVAYLADRRLEGRYRDGFPPLAGNYLVVATRDQTARSGPTNDDKPAMDPA